MVTAAFHQQRQIFQIQHFWLSTQCADWTKTHFSVFKIRPHWKKKFNDGWTVIISGKGIQIFSSLISNWSCLKQKIFWLFKNFIKKTTSLCWAINFQRSAILRLNINFNLSQSITYNRTTGREGHQLGKWVIYWTYADHNTAQFNLP